MSFSIIANVLDINSLILRFSAPDIVGQVDSGFSHYLVVAEQGEGGIERLKDIWRLLHGKLLFLNEEVIKTALVVGRLYHALP